MLSSCKKIATTYELGEWDIDDVESVTHFTAERLSHAGATNKSKFNPTAGYAHFRINMKGKTRELDAYTANIEMVHLSKNYYPEKCIEKFPFDTQLNINIFYKKEGKQIAIVQVMPIVKYTKGVSRTRLASGTHCNFDIHFDVLLPGWTSNNLVLFKYKEERFSACMFHRST